MTVLRLIFPFHGGIHIISGIDCSASAARIMHSINVYRHRASDGLQCDTTKSFKYRIQRIRINTSF